MQINDQNLTERVARLKEKMDDRRNMTLEARRAAWQRIKDDVPDIADFISQAKNAFGPLQAVKVTIGDEVVIDLKN